MMQEQLILRVVSYLFQYPNEDWFQSLGDLVEESKGIGDVQLEALIADFVAYVQDMGLRDYEEQYIRTFDFSKNTNLYLSTHNCTDSGKQAAELVEFNALFAKHGFTLDREMPDYLPALLELSSTVDREAIKEILEYANGKLQFLRDRFIEAKLPYAFLLDVVFTVTNRLEVA